MPNEKLKSAKVPKKSTYPTYPPTLPLILTRTIYQLTVQSKLIKVQPITNRCLDVKICCAQST
jgi:hypothetical protein